MHWTFFSRRNRRSTARDVVSFANIVVADSPEDTALMLLTTDASENQTMAQYAYTRNQSQNKGGGNYHSRVRQSKPGTDIALRGKTAEELLTMRFHNAAI